MLIYIVTGFEIISLRPVANDVLMNALHQEVKDSMIMVERKDRKGD